MKLKGEMVINKFLINIEGENRMLGKEILRNQVKQTKGNGCIDLSRYVSNVEALKCFPLRVASYVSGKYFGWSYFPEDEIQPQQEKLNKRIERLRNYIGNNTHWKLVASYVDFVDVADSMYKDKTSNHDFLDKREELRELLEDLQNEKKFDVIVIDSLSQISRNFVEVYDVLRNLYHHRTVIFCVDTESIMTLDDRILTAKLPEEVTIDYLYDLSSSCNYSEFINSSADESE